MTTRTKKKGPKSYFTATELAEMWEVSYQTIHKWIRRGILPCYRLPLANHACRVPIEQARRFAKKHGFPFKK